MFETFDSHHIKIVAGSIGQPGLHFYYGGLGGPDGEGHGEVKSNDGIFIHYWREPMMLVPRVDNNLNIDLLSDHGLF